MSARDKFHDPFVRSLQKDGWTITNDPLRLTIGKTDLLVDLGAEQVVAAERQEERIAVEIKSFISLSPVQDLKEALGQFVLYEDVLARSPLEKDRILYLAVRVVTYEAHFEEPLGKILLENQRVRLIVFDPDVEVIIRWIK